MSAECPHKKNCPMFSLFRLAGALRTWQIRYCDADFEGCARFRLSQQGRPVPQNLMPNGATLNVPAGK